MTLPEPLRHHLLATVRMAAFRPEAAVVAPEPAKPQTAREPVQALFCSESDLR